MSKDVASCKIVADTNDYITNWVCKGLKIGKDWLGKHFTIGFMVNDQLVGGLIYHDLRFGQDVWWTLYTTNKRWCSKKVLKFMFSLAFEYFRCRRISLMTGIKNFKCLKLAFKLGFRAEGVLQQYSDNGEDVVIMGILKSQSKF